METRFKVDGMHCEGCVSRAQKVLEREEGVRWAEVSLEAEEARVEHGAAAPDSERLREALERAGFSATELA